MQKILRIGIGGNFNDDTFNKLLENKEDDEDASV